MEQPLEVDVISAAQMLQAGALMIDVREPAEVAICAIPGSRHIPMREIPGQVGSLPTDRTLLVLCHVGVRSRHVTHFLRDNGFPLSSNVTGGIAAWTDLVDPSLARY